MIDGGARPRTTRIPGKIVRLNARLTLLGDLCVMRIRFTFTLPGRLSGFLSGLALVMACGLSANTQAQDQTATTRVIVEPVTVPAVAVPASFYRVPADQTPSGFPVPRYVSLKFGKVNARTGPSRNHPVAYQYRRRGLPLIVVAETEMWRKVRDLHGDEAWVRKPALSGERYAVLTEQVLLRARPELDARNVARIESGTLVSLETCETISYCRIRTANGLKGYAPRTALWGAQTLD